MPLPIYYPLNTTKDANDLPAVKSKSIQSAKGNRNANLN
jgi:hypothetical protein